MLTHPNRYQGKFQTKKEEKEKIFFFRLTTDLPPPKCLYVVVKKEEWVWKAAIIGFIFYPPAVFSTSHNFKRNRFCPAKHSSLKYGTSRLESNKTNVLKKIYVFQYARFILPTHSILDKNLINTIRNFTESL